MTKYISFIIVPVYQNFSSSLAQVVIGGDVEPVSGTSAATPTFASLISMFNTLRFVLIFFSSERCIQKKKKKKVSLTYL